MRTDNSRLFATLIVWGSFTSIFLFLFFVLAWTGADVNVPSAFFLLIMFLATLVGVIRATEAIWGSVPAEDPGKAKRAQNSRVRRLVDSLEDDEIYELESLLLAREDAERARRGTP
jgi:hypothetical protein